MGNEASLCAADVAQVIGVGKNKVYELARTGELASYRLGRKLRFSARDVDAYLTRCRTAAAGGAAGDGACPRRLDEQLPDAMTGGEAAPFVLAGEGVAADLLAGLLADGGESLSRRRMTSYAALVNLYCGAADLASINLYDAFANSYNLPYVQRLAPGLPVIVVRLARRPVGLVCRAGQEKRFSTWGSLLREGVRVANLQRGFGLRVLLDEKLMSMEARPENIAGYADEAGSVGESLEWVACGRADVALGAEEDAKAQRGLAFRPLQTEACDLVVRKTPKTRRLIRDVKDVAASARFAHMVQAAGGMGTEQAGAMLFEC